MVGVFTNIVSSSTRRKRAASQASIPQRPPLAPLGSNSLAKSGRRLSVAPEKGSANHAGASSIAVEELPKEVDTTDKEHTKTNEDDDCGSTTQYLPKESSIVVNSPRKDRSSINFEEISLPRVRC